MRATCLTELKLEGVGHPDKDFPDRLSVLVKDGPHIEIVKTPEGFVVDAYNRNTGKCITSMTIWNDDLEDDE